MEQAKLDARGTALLAPGSAVCYTNARVARRRLRRCPCTRPRLSEMPAEPPAPDSFEAGRIVTRLVGELISQHFGAAQQAEPAATRAAWLQGTLCLSVAPSSIPITSLLLILLSLASMRPPHRY